MPILMPENNEKITVGAAADTLGVSARTIRFWEERGLLDRPPRNGGKRIYNTDDLRRMRFIQRLKDLDLTLVEILELKKVYQIHRSNRRMLERLTEVLKEQLAKIETKIGSLEALRSEVKAYLERIEKKIASM